MRFLNNPVGRKLVMAISGFGMTAFVLAHLLGNASIFSGPNGINAYAQALHRFPPFIWAFRTTMLTLLVLHVLFGMILTIENRNAKPDRYAVRQNLSSTVASRNMIWTGLLIGVFILYHLLHFTVQKINPQFSAAMHSDALGRPDVFTMVVGNLRAPGVSLVYLCAVGALGLHLAHSIQSAFQTAGLNSERLMPIIGRAGLIVALLIFLGYAAIPAAVLTGILK